MVLTGGWHLNEGDAYFKVKEIIHMKFQNFVIFSFQITINNCIMMDSLRYSELLVDFIFLTCFIIYNCSICSLS